MRRRPMRWNLLFRGSKPTLPQVIARKPAPNGSTAFCRRARIGIGSQLSVLAVIATIGLAASAYWYVTARGGRTAIESASAPSRPSKRTNIDPVMEDLKPGVDGGSSAEVLPFSLQRQVMYYRTTVVPGSIVVDRENRFLYLIQLDQLRSPLRHRHQSGVPAARQSFPHRQQGGMAGMALFGKRHEIHQRHDSNPGGRPGQSARSESAPARSTRAAHPRHQLAEDDRSPRCDRMHSPGQRRCRGPVQARLVGHQSHFPDLGSGPINFLAERRLD